MGDSRLVTDSVGLANFINSHPQPPNPWGAYILTYSNLAGTPQSFRVISGATVDADFTANTGKTVDAVCQLTTTSTTTTTAATTSVTISTSTAAETSTDATNTQQFQQLQHFHSCFSANSTVVTNRGQMNMAKLYQLNTENIQVRTTGGHFSPLRFWLHAEPQKLAEFLRITTANGQSISMTRGHLIFKTNCERLERQTIRAERISPGDCLMVDTDGHLQAQKVLKVDKFSSVGIYSPMTLSEDLLVDNILASCYSEVEAVQIQSVMFGYIGAVKSVAKQLLPANLFSVVFVHNDKFAPVADAVEQFLLLSRIFIV